MVLDLEPDVGASFIVHDTLYFMVVLVRDVDPRRAVEHPGAKELCIAPGEACGNVFCRG